MFYFGFLFLYGVTTLVTFEDYIAKTPEGKRLVEGIKWRTLRLMEWMASSDAKKSLSGLPKFFSWTAAVLIFSIWAVGGSLPREVTNILLITFVGMVFAWTSFDWFFNFKKQIKGLIIPFLLMICMPWLLLLLEKHGVVPVEASLYSRVIPLTSTWGFGYLNEYIFAAILSVSMVVVLFFSFVFVVLLFLSVPVIIFLALILASKISRCFLDGKPRWVRLLVVLCHYLMSMYLVAISL